MIKLKRIIEQGEFAAQIAKSNAKMDALLKAPPANMLNKPNKPLCPSLLFKSFGLIPGITT